MSDFFMACRCFALLVLSSLPAYARVGWQTTTVTSGFPAGVITDESGILVPADPMGSGFTAGYDGIGYYVHFLWAGPDGVANPIRPELYVPGLSVGTEGTDDRVIDTSFIGRGRLGLGGSATNPNGHIVRQFADEVTVDLGGGPVGQGYYIRVFNATVESGRLFDDNSFASLGGGGLQPPSSATHYGDSALFVTSNPDDGQDESFLSGPIQTSVSLVPEPTSVVFFAGGLLVLRRFLR